MQSRLCTYQPPVAVNNLFAYFGSMVNFMILAIPLLNGWPLNVNSAGAVALASFQVIMLISGWSKFNNVSQKVSDVAGFASRVGQMFDVMKDLRERRPASDGALIDSIIPTPDDSLIPASAELETFSSDFAVEFVGVSIWTPRERELVRNLNLQLKQNQSLLIMGPSGCGKSTILRTLSGLWPLFSGTIRRPGAFATHCIPNQVLFLHQSPFLTSGTLKDQIAYPRRSQEVDLPENRLLDILELLELRYLLEERQSAFHHGEIQTLLDDRSNREWTEILSPGEQQRLCLARVLFWRPRFVFLDEATSAVDFQIEKAFFTKCKAYGITMMSVGHSESLKRYHNVLLHLNKAGQCTVSDLSRSSS